MYGSTAIGIRAEIAIGGTTGIGAAHRMMAPAGLGPGMKVASSSPVIGIATEDDSITTIAGIGIVIGTGVTTGTATAIATGTRQKVRPFFKEGRTHPLKFAKRLFSEPFLSTHDPQRN
jgi:hypothetical protein